jgi:aminopeptidase YwaD
LHKLCVDIGPRPGGSPGHHAAAAYIERVFRQCDLAVDVQPFACPDWQERETALIVADTPLAAAANTYSPPCTVLAPFTAVSTLAELEQAELAGRIAVLYGDLTRAPLAAKAWIFKDERDVRIIQCLEAKHPAAILTVQTRPGKLERLIEDADFIIPSATIPAKAGLELLEQPDATVYLHIDSISIPGSTANIVARLPGERSEQLVFCAHYDSKVDTPGAIDNAAGMTVLLTLAETLSRQTHPYGLEFVAFTNEEYLPLGDDEYVRRRGQTFDQIIAALNFDGVGQHLGVNSIASFNCASAFQQTLIEIVNAFASVVWVDPWPESNHSTFAWRGVPSMAFTTSGGLNQSHLRSDRIKWISIPRLVEVVTLAMEIVARTEGQPPEWTHEREPGLSLAGTGKAVMA